MIEQFKKAVNETLRNEDFEKYFNIVENEIRIKLQSGTIKENGVNGVQVVDLLEYIRNIYIEFDTAFPCIENAFTINTIQEAIHWQTKRTADREKRGVEGYNKE